MDASSFGDGSTLGGTEDGPSQRRCGVFPLQLVSASLLSSMCAINWLGVAAILTESKRYYGVGTGAMNTISNIYLAAYCVTCMPCAYATDRFGVQMALLAGGLSQAVGAALTVLGGFEMLVLGSIVAAAGQPLLVSTPAAFSHAYAPPNLRARSTTVVSVCNNLGSAVVFAVAPRVTEEWNVRGWLIVRAAIAVGIFLVALLAFGVGGFTGGFTGGAPGAPAVTTTLTTTTPQKTPSSGGTSYAKRTFRMVSESRAFLWLLAAYCLGQGAFWSWAEFPDLALGRAKSDTSIGSVGAVITVVACVLSLLFGNVVDSEMAPIDVVLFAAQATAAVALFAFFACLKFAPEEKWTYLAPCWLAFSLSSTPVMPLGAELAARLAPAPDLVGAAVGAAFVVAEISSAVLGFGLGSSGKLEGPTLMLVLFVITLAAAVAALGLVLDQERTRRHQRERSLLYDRSDRSDNSHGGEDGVSVHEIDVLDAASSLQDCKAEDAPLSTPLLLR